MGSLSFEKVLTFSVYFVLLFSLTEGKLPELEWHKLEEFISDDFEVSSYPNAPTGGSLVHWSSPGTVPSSGRNYTVHVGSLFSGLPQSFSFQLPPEGERPD